MAAGLRPPSWIFENLNVAVIALIGQKLATKFQKDRSSDLKVIAILKMQMGQCCNRLKSKMAA
jgi:hypothetical protein